ncbi:flagellar brake protein [Candidatus Acidulodesulfobacterium sp. H_13]|uniref:flagellar brake protein n=1 Tax=Candidatus Acidulodesulfobacterium sp. H_13 TaxID=3395470 RepID=UPI003AF8C03A
MFEIKKLKENPDIKIYSRKHEIHAILKNFANQKKPIVIIPIPFSEEYFTNIIEVNNDYIIIDSIIPKVGNIKLAESSYLKAVFKFNNNEHYFISKLYDYKKYKEYFVFYIYKPIEILSLEKRKFFRIEPSVNRPVRLSFLSDDRYYDTKMFDLSGEGFSFLLKFPLEKHTILEEVKIKFPDELPDIMIRAEIRSTIKLNNLKYKIGAQAINLKPKAQDIMFRYIFKRQREIVAFMKGSV